MSGTSATPSDRERFWLGHLRACGGGSMKDYAAAHDLDRRGFYDAKARLRRKGLLSTPPAPVRLVRLERAPAAAPCRIHLPNGVSIELACAPEALPALLAAAAALR